MNFKRQTRAAPDVNLTPLIDVVFLLLIFFMVTTTF
ncbi:MAG: biopolymer transporter ExbD, partial [Sinobacterium sp.]